MKGVAFRRKSLLWLVPAAAVIALFGSNDPPSAEASSSDQPDMETVVQRATPVPPYIFTDHFERYQGSWVRFQNYSLRCEANRDRSVQCTNTNGTAAVAVFYDRIANVDGDGRVSPKVIGPYDRSIACQNPLFYFTGTVPTSNPNFVGVHVDTLYCD